MSGTTDAAGASGRRTDRKASATDRRFVVSIRTTGLGDRLISLAAAWRFARLTGRTLVADWRFGGFTDDTTQNPFSRCFEAPEVLAGASFVGDRHLSPECLPTPRYPSVWNTDTLLALPFLLPPEGEAAKLDAVDMIRAGRDVDAETVVFSACVNDGIVDLEEARTFFSALRPVAPITRAVASLQSECFGAGPVIGLHVRHGNGGDIMGHAPYWKRSAAAIDRCVSAVRHAEEQFGERATTFVATDSAEVEEALREQIPRLVTRSKSFRPRGEGDLHSGPGAWVRRSDALIEMVLLASCDALVRYPPGSFFSLYAATLLAPHGGEAKTLYDLQRPWDGESLSPAIIPGRS